MAKWWTNFKIAILGNGERNLEDEPNPLRNVEKSTIKTRAWMLIDCGLEDQSSYILQAVVLITSADQWRDTALRRDVQIVRPETEALQNAARNTHSIDRSSNFTIRHSNEATKNPVNTVPSGDRIVMRKKLSDKERRILEDDLNHGRIYEQLWHQPRAMKWFMFLCGIGAMVQGWDEAAVNGAQVYYRKAYNLNNDFRVGLLNASPYLCCFFSCWLSWPLNKWLGRKKTIALTAVLSMAFALAQGFANDWHTMLALRFCMGLGIGPKSATIPIYASEVAPANLRGALVMMWQLFTALGIMFGYLAGVVFANVGNGNAVLRDEVPCSVKAGNDLLSMECSLNWRLMIGSPAIAPIFLFVFIFFLPESPRWLLTAAQRRQREYLRFMTDTQQSLPSAAEQPHLPDLTEVFDSLKSLRGGSSLKAARDLLIIDVLLYEQRRNRESKSSPELVTGGKFARNVSRGTTELKRLFTNTRDFSALRASTIVMFLQQYCGINILIYYSTLVIFDTSDGSDNPRLFLGLSAVVGAINFICGLPAILLIDRVGRRKLLLWTFPFLGLFAIFVAIGTLPQLDPLINTNALVLAGMYLFVVFYSPGEGPVPFVYASESFPQETRDLGMSVVTSINWGLNFLVAITFPLMISSPMSFTGPFWFYGVWCWLGFILVLLFVPETSKLELERLDDVFTQDWKTLVRSNWYSFYGSKRRPRPNAKSQPAHMENGYLQTGHHRTTLSPDSRDGRSPDTRDVSADARSPSTERGLSPPRSDSESGSDAGLDSVAMRTMIRRG